MTANLFPTPAVTAPFAPPSVSPSPAGAVFYPESDGEPLPDGQHQAPLYRAIVSTLEIHFRDYPDTSVNGNTFIYYEEGNPRRHIAPDCYVAFGVNVAALLERNTYLLWEMGKAPDFVLEIASESTAAVDTGRKRILYAAIGCGEYWLYDATGDDYYDGPLEGGYLGSDGWYHSYPLHRESDGMVWAHSPALSLDLCWIDGRLRFYHPATQRWLPNFTETTDLLATERAALAVERAARQTAEARIAQLEAELRRRDAAN